jgi:hypothetical protein
MNKLDEQQKRISNQDVDWARIYDFAEIELREMYRTVSKMQNDSHFELLKSKCCKYFKKNV